jgi:hypothetical protein
MEITRWIKAHSLLYLIVRGLTAARRVISHWGLREYVVCCFVSRLDAALRRFGHGGAYTGKTV